MKAKFAAHRLHNLIDMKLHINQEADALYLRLDNATIIESEGVAPGIVLDYNEAN